MRFLLGLAAALVVTSATRRAAAENCVDKEVWRKQGYGHPCMDVGTSMGRGEFWTAPGLTDLRVSIMRIGLYGNDQTRRGTAFDLATWEVIGDADGDLEHPRDFGQRSAVHAISLRRQIDRDGWGAYVAGDGIARFYGHTRFLTPRFGVRLGRFDHAAAVVEARLSGTYLGGLGDGPQRSFARDADISARATYVLTRRIRLESRARYRDLRAVDGRLLRDLFVSAGFEGEVSPPGPASTKGPNTWRVLTLYAGIGLRRALVDVDPTRDDASPSLDRMTSPPLAPWELMLTVDLDVAINSQLSIW